MKIQHMSEGLFSISYLPQYMQICAFCENLVMNQVEVCLRIKPEAAAPCIYEYGEASIVDAQNQVYTFSSVIKPSCSNSELCDRLSSLMDSALAGYNVTIMAYGQSSSGKTYTMLSDDGIVLSFAQKLFEKKAAFSVQIMELYNESLRDLTSHQQIELFEQGGDVILRNASQTTVKTNAEFQELLTASLARRATSQTLLNQGSSRSHCIIQLLLSDSVLTFCDLAGSEKLGKTGAEGAELREANGINSALLALGRVVQALSTGAKFVPYRDSKLTRLLRNSVNGSSFCTIVACVSADKTHESETASTIRFCERAMNIKGEVLKVEEQDSIDSAVLKGLRTEVATLRAELEPVEKVDFSSEDDLLEEEYGDLYFEQAAIIKSLTSQLAQTRKEGKLRIVEEIEKYKCYKNKEILRYKKRFQQRIEELEQQESLEKVDKESETVSSAKYEDESFILSLTESRRSSGISEATLSSISTFLGETCVLKQQTVASADSTKPLTTTISGTDE